RYERTDRHHYRQPGDNQRQFIAEHLRDRAHGAEHGKFVIARPSGHEHCKFRCRSYGEEKEYAAVYREGRHISAIRNHAQREDRHRREDDRREKMHDLIRTRGHDVFLDQHFDAVSDGLEQTEWADAIRAIAVLHPRENFPLQHRYKRKEREKHRKHRNNVDEAGDDLDQPTWRTGNQEKQPSLQMNKDLVKRRTHLSARKAIAADLIKSESQVRRCESGVEPLISKRAAPNASTI